MHALHKGGNCSVSAEVQLASCLTTHASVFGVGQQDVLVVVNTTLSPRAWLLVYMATCSLFAWGAMLDQYQIPLSSKGPDFV